MTTSVSVTVDERAYDFEAGTDGTLALDAVECPQDHEQWTDLEATLVLTLDAVRGRRLAGRTTT